MLNKCPQLCIVNAAKVCQRQSWDQNPGHLALGPELGPASPGTNSSLPTSICLLLPLGGLYFLPSLGASEEASFAVTLGILIANQREGAPACLLGHPFPNCTAPLQVRCTHPVPRVTRQATGSSRERTKACSHVTGRPFAAQSHVGPRGRG